jgi:hypothetical protein
MAEALRKAGAAETPLFREAPHNIEAEQALLGAILVNNDAFYRVSDFLKSSHFHEPLHRKIFEVAGDMIRLGKIANPVTMKTFLPAEERVGELTVTQYLARLAAEAVTGADPMRVFNRYVYNLRASYADELEKIVERREGIDFAPLEKIVAEMDEAARIGDIAGVHDADVRFHEWLVRTSEQPHTIQLWQSILPRVRAQFIRLGGYHSSASDIVVEHAELLEAVENWELPRINDLLDEHISGAAQRLLERKHMSNDTA